MITAAELVERARAWIGVPFHHQGRSRHGIDCVGLPEVLLREAGALPQGFRVKLNYGRLPAADLDAGLRRWCMPLERPLAGALVTIQWPGSASFSHVAICTGPTIIHATQKRGVHEHAYRANWRTWTRGAWALPGVIYE